MVKLEREILGRDIGMKTSELYGPRKSKDPEVYTTKETDFIRMIRELNSKIKTRICSKCFFRKDY